MAPQSHTFCSSGAAMAAAPSASAEFSFSSAIRGHHVYKSTRQPIIGKHLEIERENYKSTRQPIIGKHLEIERENGNSHDRFTVAIIKVCPTRTIVGHIPREISKISWHFLSHGGEGKCIVIARRWHSPLV